ncbi:uncharacterized protein [Arachis hypogaea]|uniref:uncharacterized protein n=1 Tax=Arachis hypogaea TaxID=3818 RepID=UPI000DEC6EE9|nr:uncharacterized protein LOC112709146 [Arachis hypogaea]
MVRLWESPSKFNEKELGSIEMILQNIKDDRIHASIPNPVLKKWLGNIQKFCMYVMSNFIVVDNKIKSRVTSVKWVLTFSHRTIVSPIENPNYSFEAFRLKTITELLNAEKLDNTELFDMIAEVVGKENQRELVTSKGKKTRRLAVVLEDLDTSRISQVTTQGAWSATDELNNGVVIVKTEGTYWIIGTIVAINVGKNYWFYKSCRKCPKKVETPIGYRFKVKVIVYDGTGSISLLLWDRETTQLYRKRADQVREEEDPMEASVSSLKSKIPVKGTSNDMKCGFSSTNINDEEGQFSTNKFTRKTNKRQKI